MRVNVVVSDRLLPSVTTTVISDVPCQLSAGVSCKRESVIEVVMAAVSG